VSGRRVLLLGFDAADGDLALRMIREGRLPTLAGLAARGIAMPMRSTGEHMPESSWASLISGCRPGEHGIYSWRIVRPGTLDLARMDQGGWRRPFWSILRERAPDPKPRVVVFDVPYAPSLPGEGVTVVGGWGLRVTRQGSSWPPGLFDELSARHGSYPGWINRDYDRNPVSERRYRRMLKRLARRRTAIALDLLGREEWDCALVNFTEPHFAGHAFFHHVESAEPGRRRDGLAAPTGMADVYEETDRNLARIVEAAGPTTDVLVFSTIGLRPNECSKDLLGEVMIALGYEVRATPSPRGRARRLATTAATTVMPRVIRHRIRSLIPAGTTESIADRAWADAIDWPRSRAVSEAEPGSSWLRLNLVGREPSGIVDPADRDALVAEITAELERLTDPDTGNPAVAEVVPAAEIAPGPLTEQIPDLLVRWAPGKRLRSVHHPSAGTITDRGGPYARTEHNGDGFLVAAGPGISAAGAPEGVVPNEVDIAPTVLQLFGSPVPQDMQGSVLEWLLAEPGAVEREPIDVAAEPVF